MRRDPDLAGRPITEGVGAGAPGVTAAGRRSCGPGDAPRAHELTGRPLCSAGRAGPSPPTQAPTGQGPARPSGRRARGARGVRPLGRRGPATDGRRGAGGARGAGRGRPRTGEAPRGGPRGALRGDSGRASPARPSPRPPPPRGRRSAGGGFLEGPRGARRRPEGCLRGAVPTAPMLPTGRVALALTRRAAATRSVGGPVLADRLAGGAPGPSSQPKSRRGHGGGRGADIRPVARADGRERCGRCAAARRPRLSRDPPPLSPTLRRP